MERRGQKGGEGREEKEGRKGGEGREGSEEERRRGGNLEEWRRKEGDKKTDLVTFHLAEFAHIVKQESQHITV